MEEQFKVGDIVEMKEEVRSQFRNTQFRREVVAVTKRGMLMLRIAGRTGESFWSANLWRKVNG